MASTISVYDQTSQPRMLLIENPAPRLLQERYFPTDEPMDLFDSKSVLLDFDDGDYAAGAFVSKGYVNGDTTTYFANNVIPPRVGVSDTIDCSDKDRVLFESLCRNDLSPSHADALDALLRIKAARCVNRASRSIEKLCVEVLKNNSIQFTMDTSPTDSTQITVDVEYFDSSNSTPNPQSWSPSATTKNWGQSGATPYKDVCEMVKVLVQHGGRAEDLLMSPAMWDILYNDMTSNTFKDQIHYTGMANGDVKDLFSAEVEDAKCVGQAQFHGHVLNLIVYNGGYKNSSGVFVNYLPDDFLCILAPGCGRTLCGACALPNPAAMINGGAADIRQVVGKFLVYKFYDFANECVSVRCSSNPLPSPRSAWRWVSYKAAV